MTIRRLISIFFEKFTINVFGNILFSIPGLYILRKASYRLVFGIKKPKGIEHDVFIKTQTKLTKGRFKCGKKLALSRGVLLDVEGILIIGNNVNISRDVMIFTHSHLIKENRLSEMKINRSCLEIHDEVWIGARAIILPTVKRIGKGAIIGAGAVVTKEVEPCSIVAGNPAKEVGKRSIKL